MFSKRSAEPAHHQSYQGLSKSIRGCSSTCMSVMYRCVNKKKNDEKGYFFQAGQCAELSSFRIGKCYEKTSFFICESKAPLFSLHG